MARWTDAEVARLRQLVEQGMTANELARHITTHSREAIRHKAKALGLVIRRDRPLRRAPHSWVPNIDLMHRNSLAGYSDLAREGYRMLEQGLDVIARHGRDGYVVWGGARMPYVDAVQRLLSALHERARLIRSARRIA